MFVHSMGDRHRMKNVKKNEEKKSKITAQDREAKLDFHGGYLFYAVGLTLSLGHLWYGTHSRRDCLEFVVIEVNMYAISYLALGYIKWEQWNLTAWNNQCMLSMHCIHYQRMSSL